MSSITKPILVAERNGIFLYFCSRCLSIIQDTKAAITAHLKLCFPLHPSELVLQELGFFDKPDPPDTLPFREWLYQLHLPSGIQQVPLLHVHHVQGCDACTYCVVSLTSIRAHCREKHQPPATWSSVPAQAFGSGDMKRSIRVIDEPTVDQPSLGARLHQSKQQNIAQQAQSIARVDKRAEPNRFLEEMKFDVHAAGFDPQHLLSLVTTSSSEGTLNLVMEHLKNISLRARESLISESFPILTQLNRRKADTVATTMFYYQITDASLSNYLIPWHKLLRYMTYITTHHEEPTLYPGSLTQPQDAAMTKILAYDWAHGGEEEKDDLIYELFQVLTRQPLRADAFENILLSGLALAALNDRDASWAQAVNYQCFSGIVKIFLFVTYEHGKAYNAFKAGERSMPPGTSPTPKI
ncbi:hypothetical protein F4861DRAFT_544413 [Xylaria intraflava]|nr:hypothetical protein F4861DRAFT_544413 [Xylaria intraflava]